MKKLTTAAVLAAVVIGTPVAAAAPAQARPVIDQSGDCGPGYYPYEEYGRCVPHKTLKTPGSRCTHQHWWNPFSWGC